MSEPYIGEIRLFACKYQPRGWLFCQGQIVEIKKYKNLFALINNNYGGDGRKTFGIPDLRGRVSINQGTGTGLTPQRIGKMSGMESICLMGDAYLPPHTHTLMASTQAANSTSPVNNALAPRQRALYCDNVPDDTMIAGSITSAGNGVGYDNMQSFLVLNYCIATEGIIPQRGD